jgi:hypothetical protein
MHDFSGSECSGTTEWDEHYCMLLIDEGYNGVVARQCTNAEKCGAVVEKIPLGKGKDICSCEIVGGTFLLRSPSKLLKNGITIQ